MLAAIAEAFTQQRTHIDLMDVQVTSDTE